MLCKTLWNFRSTPENNLKVSCCHNVEIVPITYIIWRVWVCFKWLWCFAQKASQLRESAASLRIIKAHEKWWLQQELPHQPSFVRRWFRRRRCSNLTLTVCPASANSPCPVPVFDRMRPVTNAEEVSAERWIMSEWSCSGAHCPSRSACLGKFGAERLCVTRLWGSLCVHSR